MRRSGRAMFAMFVTVLLLVPPPSGQADEAVVPRVEIVRTPDGGIQPQAVIDMSATAPKRLILDTRKDDAHVLAEEDVVNLPAAGEEAST